MLSAIESRNEARARVVIKKTNSEEENVILGFAAQLQIETFESGRPIDQIEFCGQKLSESLPDQAEGWNEYELIISVFPPAA